MLPKRYFQILSVSLYVAISACTLLQLPLPVPPSQTPLPQPPIEPEKPQPQSPPQPQTESRPPIFRDPDGLSPIFEKEASTVYLNTYAGVARAGAKTSVSEEPTKYFETVGDVLKNLPTDSYMRRQGLGDNSPRTADENLNVFIKKAYIFFISEEEDQDFHLIIGDLASDGVTKKNLMTAEISGLPKDRNTRSYFLLERTRRQLYERFPEFFTSNKKTFRPRTKFLPVILRGSLFFDTRHSAGKVGEGDTKPETVWEVHPVSYLEFLE